MLEKLTRLSYHTADHGAEQQKQRLVNEELAHAPITNAPADRPTTTGNADTDVLLRKAFNAGRRLADEHLGRFQPDAAENYFRDARAFRGCNQSVLLAEFLRAYRYECSTYIATD